MLFSWPDSEGLLRRQEIKSCSVLIPQINEKHISLRCAVVHQLMMSLLGGRNKVSYRRHKVQFEFYTLFV